MAVDEVFSYIESFTNLERTPGVSMRPYRLDRMGRLLSLFGNPERAPRVVHVAGSKGKGSTAVFAASILRAAGFRVGLYTSPHVSSYKERITLAGGEIADEEFIRGFDELRSRIPDRTVPGLPGDESPTTFELLTLLAFLMFRRLRCDWAIVETGIGGRLDATNLVQPEVAVITPIELEHTEILGKTIGEIAREKAGIIKRGSRVFCGYQLEEAYAVLQTKAAECSAPMTRLADELSSFEPEMSDYRMTVRYLWTGGACDTVRLGMTGSVQAENGALAYLIGKAILERDRFAPEAVRAFVLEGLAAAGLPGRMEVARHDPLIMLDAAHTPSSIARLVDSFTRMVPAPRNLIFGSVAGKRHEEMARILAPHFDRIVISTPGTFKKSDPTSVWRAFRRHRPAAILEPDPKAALDLALRSETGVAPILVTGSFYMIAEIRALIESVPMRNI